MTILVRRSIRRSAMCRAVPHPRTLIPLSLLLIGLLVWTATGSAQTLSGQARAVQATVADVTGTSSTTVLADSGTLGASPDAREASQTTGEVPGLLTGEVLHATTISSGGQVGSEASLAALALVVAGTSIGADFVMARALAVPDAAASGTAHVDNLSVNGVAIDVTGSPNQTIAIPGGSVVINEQQSSSTGIVVNALHIVVTGVADVVIGSATARVE